MDEGRGIQAEQRVVTNIQTQERAAPSSGKTQRSLTCTRGRVCLGMCGANARAAVSLPFVCPRDGSGPATEATGQWLRLSHTGYSLGWQLRVVGSANAASEFDGILYRYKRAPTCLNYFQTPMFMQEDCPSLIWCPVTSSLTPLLEMGGLLVI